MDPISSGPGANAPHCKPHQTVQAVAQGFCLLSSVPEPTTGSEASNLWRTAEQVPTNLPNIHDAAQTKPPALLQHSIRLHLHQLVCDHRRFRRHLIPQLEI